MSAIISECGQYRYQLSRKTKCPLRWVKRCLFIMLNPSTADAEKDDPTIRRCLYFAGRAGCTDLTVVNLFALRSTDPSTLASHVDPQGPENMKHIVEAFESHELVIAAWGAHPMAKCSLAKEIAKLDGVFCLGKTKDGSPRHPLYVRKDQPLIPLGGQT